MVRGATIVCTIGTIPALLVQWLDTPKEKDRLITDPDMRVKGIPNVWAVGDCAVITNAYDGLPAPTTGQFAERQGRQVAKNILRVLQGQPTRPFSYKSLGTLCGIGERNAVAEILGVRLSGFPAWWLWRTVYLFEVPVLVSPGQACVRLDLGTPVSAGSWACANQPNRKGYQSPLPARR